MSRPDQPETHDAREGSGDPTSDPAAAGEQAFEHPDGDGGATPGDGTGSPS